MYPVFHDILWQVGTTLTPSVLAGIIQIVDVEFDGEENAQIVSQNVGALCNQLGLDEHAIELALTKKCVLYT